MPVDQLVRAAQPRATPDRLHPGRVLAPALVLVCTADAATTWYALERFPGAAVEANPLVRFAMSGLGVSVTLLLSIAFSLWIASWLVDDADLLISRWYRWYWVAVVGLRTAVVISNVALILSLHSSG